MNTQRISSRVAPDLSKARGGVRWKNLKNLKNQTIRSIIMIWHPEPGMTVELRYRKSNRKDTPHGARGVIVVASKGPGPINAAVKIGDETLIVPRGNLKEEK